MYKCSECDLIYEHNPQYCECGNDIFEDITEEQYDTAMSSSFFETEEEVLPSKPMEQKLIASLIFFIISTLIAIVFIILALTKDSAEVRSQKAEEYKAQQIAKNVYIPSIDKVWDSTPPRGSSALQLQFSNKKSINTRMTSLDVATKRYMIDVGKSLLYYWDRSDVIGNGICEVQFFIDNRGKVHHAGITKPSNNNTLDTSINNMIKRVTTMQVPPEGYKNELITIAFQVKNGEFKIYYPNK